MDVKKHFERRQFYLGNRDGVRGPYVVPACYSLFLLYTYSIAYMYNMWCIDRYSIRIVYIYSVQYIYCIRIMYYIYIYIILGGSSHLVSGL